MMATSVYECAGLPELPDNVIAFPLSRSPTMRGCPQCGACSDVWQIGRLIWGYCVEHEVRWVTTDLHDVREPHLDRQHMRRGLEFLASFLEVSH